ncbi:MAG: DUF177 domain-containing protein, partial [Elusimicrobia bacterium]|nr:DUF177 domain-containing protein [Elusimicrobiota bacterium]
MKISLQELKKKKRIEGTYGDATLGEQTGHRQDSPLEISFMAEISGDTDIMLKTAMSGELTFVCDRCLEEFKYNVLSKDKRKIDTNEFGNEFNLDGEIRENLLL